MKVYDQQDKSQDKEKETMKTLKTNYDEARELVHQIAEFDPMSIEIIICMTIDTESAEYKESVIDILDRVCTAVHAVNEALGPYRIDKKGES